MTAVLNVNESVLFPFVLSLFEDALGCRVTYCVPLNLREICAKLSPKNDKIYAIINIATGTTIVQ